MADLNRSVEGFMKTLSVLNEAGGDIAEEKFEQLFGKYDLSWLLTKRGVGGTLARILAAIPADVRLGGLSLLAAYIDHRKDINPVLKLGVVSVLRAAPQGITAMLAEKEVNVDELAKEIDKEIESVPKPDETPKVPAPKKGRGFQALAGISDPKKKYLDGFGMCVAREVDDDHGLGFEGLASQLQAAMTLGLDSDPEAFERMIPDSDADADRLLELAAMSPAQIVAEQQKQNTPLLPLSARRFAHAVMAAYRVDHPKSDSAARTADWWDRLWNKVPAAVKPKRSGWAGVIEMVTSPMGCGFFLFVAFAVFLGFMALGVVGLLAHFLALRPLYRVVMPGVWALISIFDPYMDDAIMAVQVAAVAVWLAAILLMFGGMFHKKWEELRPRAQTVRIIANAVGLGSAIVGWETGHINSAMMGAQLSAIWLIILLCEFSNKFSKTLGPAFAEKSMQRFVTVGSPIAAGVLVLAIVLASLVNHDDRGRVTVLATGVTNHVEDIIAKKAGVELPLTADQCQRGLSKISNRPKFCGAYPAEKICACP